MNLRLTDIFVPRPNDRLREMLAEQKKQFINSSVREGQDNCRAQSSAMYQIQMNLPEPGWDRGWERMDTCVCMVESLCCSTKTTTILLIGYIPTQSKNF